MVVVDETLEQLTRLLRTGCTRAAGALSNLMRTPVELALPAVRCVPPSALGERLIGDGAAIAVIVPCAGAFGGWSVFGLNLETAGLLIRQLDQTAVPPHSPRSRELLCELASVVVNACLAELGSALRASIAATGVHCRLVTPDQPLVLAASNAVDMAAFTAPAQLK
jgi:hypothetical protein